MLRIENQINPIPMLWCVLKNFFVLITIIILTISLSALDFAIPYQGYIKESGVAISGSYTLSFSIYSNTSGGTVLWSSGDQTVALNEGVFNYLLGSSNSFTNIDWSTGTKYLEVYFSGSALVPRVKLGGSFYSEYANRAGKIDWSGITNIPAGFADGIDGAEVNSIDSSHIIDGSITTNDIDIILKGSMLKSHLRNQDNTLAASDLNPIQAVYVDANGNVGIGTTSPGERLDIIGNAEINGNLIVTGRVDGVDISLLALHTNDSGNPHGVTSAHVGLGNVQNLNIQNNYTQNDGEYIATDEFDTGKRNLFNYGHCFGHALESASNFEICHGEAVLVGMGFAMRE